jgi:hypothetical protein
MSLPPLADVDALEVWLGRTFSAAEEPRAEAVLAGVSSRVRSVARRTWEDDPVPAEIEDVTIRVAARVLANPLNAQQSSTGPFSASGIRVEFTAEERAVIARYRAEASGLWTMGTTRNDAAGDTIYVPVVGSDKPMPLLEP